MYISNLSLKPRIAIFISSLFLVAQVVCGYFFWDSSGILRQIITLFLTIVQFPIFPLAILDIFLNADATTEERISIFWILVFKYHIIAFSYTLLMFHFLTGQRWSLCKCGLFILSVMGILSLTMQFCDINHPSCRNFRLTPVEVFAVIVLYLLFRKKRTKRTTKTWMRQPGGQENYPIERGVNNAY